MSHRTICALTFLSIHDVMRAEKMLKARGLAVRLIPVPKQVSPECGMALQVACSAVEEVKVQLGDSLQRLKAVYRIAGTAFAPLEEGL